MTGCDVLSVYLAKPFLKAKPRIHYQVGVLFADVSVMPGLKDYLSYILFIFGETENKAVIGGVLQKPFCGLCVFIPFVKGLIGGGHYIKRQTRFVLAGAGNGNYRGRFSVGFVIIPAFIQV